jgi:transposase, IS5 family
LRERIADGIALRRFTDFYRQPVTKDDAFQRAFVRLTAQTMRSVNEVLVQAAVALGLEDGNKLGIDTTVAQTDIRHPTDNTLLWDVVRVVTRLVGRLADASGAARESFEVLARSNIRLHVGCTRLGFRPTGMSARANSCGQN